MGPIHGRGDSAVRRFVVTVEVLSIESGYYRHGDVLTGVLLGGTTAKLLSLGAVREDDYDLRSIFDDLDEAPRERL